jgi:hypothetical protein
LSASHRAREPPAIGEALGAAPNMLGPTSGATKERFLAAAENALRARVWQPALCGARANPA